MYMLTNTGHYHHKLFIFAMRSLTVVCCSAFASNCHITSWNAYSLCTRTEARFGYFFFSCQHQTGIDTVIFVANMVNIIHSMQHIQFLYGYNRTIRYPFYHMPLRQWRHWLEVEYSHKDQFIPILVATVFVWIATKQTIGSNVERVVWLLSKRCVM